MFAKNEETFVPLVQMVMEVPYAVDVLDPSLCPFTRRLLLQPHLA
jgi:hypothetical protein